MHLFTNGNRTPDYVEGVNWNYTIVWVWESNQKPIQVWNRNPIQVFKRDSNPWICCKVESKQYKCSNMGIEPMNHVYETNSGLEKKILIFFIFFFYTLVLVFVNYGAVIIAFYEAVHCLFGHHKFGWISLHRFMRSV